MPHTPAEIYRVIEPIFITQGFGENSASYARFGLKGHNGWDWRTKWLDSITLKNGRVLPPTPNGKRGLLATWFLELYKKGFDPSGYGDFFEVVVKLYSTWKITYGHCSSIHDWKTRSEGEEMAISGSTGNSTGDHVHETCKRIKIVNGTHQVQSYNNGFFGAVNNQEFYDELKKWKVEHKDQSPESVVEGAGMEMYQGYNLDDKASMRVAVDSLIRVVKREVIPANEVKQQLDAQLNKLIDEKNRAVDEAFKRGIDSGKAEAQVLPPQPVVNEQIDLSGWNQNGMVIEITEGSTKIIKNYVKKG